MTAYGTGAFRLYVVIGVLNTNPRTPAKDSCAATIVTCWRKIVLGAPYEFGNDRCRLHSVLD